MADYPLEKIARCLISIETFNDIGGAFDKPMGMVERGLCVKLLQEELDEYVEAFETENNNEIMDALGDIFYLLWGTICKEGLKDKFWNILQEICRSNISKFDATLDDARLTAQNYDEKNIIVRQEWADKYKVYVTKREDGKILKSHNYKEPNFNNI